MRPILFYLEKQEDNLQFFDWRVKLKTLLNFTREPKTKKN